MCATEHSSERPRYAELDLETFLWTTITTDSGWFCLTHIPAGLANTKEGKGEYKQEWYAWPDDKFDILQRVDQLREANDVYFSPFLFSKKKSQKEFALPTRTIIADLDEANILTIPIKPTILVQTSDERHQGYWILKEQEEKHEEYAQRLTYSIPRCDLGGWFIGKFLRVPNTFNYKYKTGPQHVTIVAVDESSKYTALDFDFLPKLENSIGIKVDMGDGKFEWIDTALASDIGPQELLATLRTKLPPRIVATYDIESNDRSAALWALTTNAFRAMCSREQVYYLAYHSANNKFGDLKSGGRLELARDVLRAQAEVKNPSADIRTRIMEARKLRGLQIEKKMFIAGTIKESLQKEGQFLHCNDDTLWYIRDDVGRPISISNRSASLDVMLDTMFGINSTEGEATFTKSHLVAYCSELPQSGVIAALSFYDVETSNLFIHTGRKDVLLVNKSEVKVVTNGHQGIIFPWHVHAKPLVPDKGTIAQGWAELLYRDCLDNLTTLPIDQALAILRIWTIMIVMRQAVVSRPILTLLGQPGAGKSTLFRRVYLLLYGEQRSLNSITSADDFDFAVASDPLVVFDNVDTWERWLPDKLALSVTVSEVTRRKLYTDNETVTLKRQAFLGLTAHNPKFGREDVADRLLILNFERLKDFKPESVILDQILKNRNRIWGDIVGDIQKALNTPMPHHDEIPQFRVEDFARTGYWIAKALGIHELFSSAIKSLRKEQRVFSLEEDQLLIKVLDKLLQKMKPESKKEFRAAGQWWSRLQTEAGDEATLFTRQYGSAQKLGKKFWSLQEALKEVYDIEWILDTKQGARHWRFLDKVA